MPTPLVSRSAAGLRPARSAASNIASEGVTAHHAGPSPWGNVDRSSAAAFQRSTDHNRCASIWRGFQSFHIDGRGWTDIAYSAGVCPHGTRYMGRGAGKRTAANGTNAGNARSEAVCYIGGQGDPLTDAARHAFVDMAAELEGRTLRWDHSDWKATECAGSAIRAWEATGWRRPGGAAPSAPSAPPVLPPAAGGVFRVGSRGAGVKFLQGMLNIITSRWPLGNRKPIDVDGIYGNGTAARVAEFQRWARGMQSLSGERDERDLIDVDGMAGPQTLGAIAFWVPAALKG